MIYWFVLTPNYLQEIILIFYVLKMILTLLLTITFAHTVLYFSCIHFFHISTLSSKQILFIVLTILSIGFMVTSIIGRWMDHPILHIFSWIFSVWYGMVIFLLLASVFLWIIVGVRFCFINQWQVPIGLSIASYGIAILVSIFAIWNAYHPVLTRIQVPIKNLPDNWNHKVIVQLSDVHLGEVWGPEYIIKLLPLIQKANPELIVITGDLFDGRSTSFESFIPNLKKINAPKGVYFICGNHEVYNGFYRRKESLTKANFTILDNKIITIDGIQLIGIPFPEIFGGSYGETIDIVHHPDFKPALPKILLFHTPTDIGSAIAQQLTNPSKMYFKPDICFDTAQKLGIDLQLSGHTHAGQLWPYTWLTRYLFEGYDYGLHKIGNMAIYISSGTGTWGPPMRLGSRSEVVAIELVKAK